MAVLASFSLYRSLYSPTTSFQLFRSLHPLPPADHSHFPFSLLPFEVGEMITARLPLPTLLAFRCVAFYPALLCQRSLLAIKQQKEQDRAANRHDALEAFDRRLSHHIKRTKKEIVRPPFYRRLASLFLFSFSTIERQERRDVETREEIQLCTLTFLSSSMVEAMGVKNRLLYDQGRVLYGREVVPYWILLWLALQGVLHSRAFHLPTLRILLATIDNPYLLFVCCALYKALRSAERWEAMREWFRTLEEGKQGDEDEESRKIVDDSEQRRDAEGELRARQALMAEEKKEIRSWLLRREVDLGFFETSFFIEELHAEDE